jgi:hypothetical protein
VKGDFFQSSFGKGMGSTFFLKGWRPFQGIVSWVELEGRGLVVSKARGLWFFAPFLKEFFLGFG